MIDAISKTSLLSLCCLIAACGQNPNRDYEVLAEQGLKCPEGARVEYRPWGGAPTGLIAICKMDHGPYAIAVNGTIVSKGENFMGKEVLAD